MFPFAEKMREHTKENREFVWNETLKLLAKAQAAK